MFEFAERILSLRRSKLAASSMLLAAAAVRCRAAWSWLTRMYDELRKWQHITCTNTAFRVRQDSLAKELGHSGNRALTSGWPSYDP